MVADKKPTKNKKQRTATAAKSKTKPKKAAKTDAAVTIDRRGKYDRRRQPDRRTKNEPVAEERRTVQRRAKVNRRRQIDPTTCERDYQYDEIEFMNAMDNYKRTSGRMFPTCSEVLEVIKSLGYVKSNTTDSPEPRPEESDRHPKPPAMPSVEISIAENHNPSAV